MNVRWHAFGVPYAALLKTADSGYLEPLGARLSVRGGDVDALVARIAAPERVRTVVTQLTEAERRALWTLLCSTSGPRGTSYRQAAERIDALTKHPGFGRLAVERLRATGLVVSLAARGGDRLYVPAEVQTTVWPLFLRDGDRFHRRAPLPDDTAPAPLRLLHDLTALLAYASQHGIRLTLDDRPYRTDEKPIMSRYWTSPDLPEAGDHSVRTAWLFAYALDRGLLHVVSDESDIKRVETGPRAASWCDADAKARFEDVLAYALAALFPFPRTYALVPLLARLPAGTELHLGELRATLGAYVPPYRHDYSTQGYEPPYAQRHHLGAELEGALALFAELGLVVTGRDGYLVGPDVTAKFGGEWPALAEAVPLYVQPNLEILASRRLPTSVLWRLHQLADVQEVDEMERFALTRDTIARALAAGFDEDAIVAFLTEHARAPLPQNVAYSLSDWSRHWGRIRLAQGVLLFCDDADLAQTLAAHPKIRPFLFERIGERHFLCEANRLVQLREALEKAGFAPLPGLLQPGERTTQHTEPDWRPADEDDSLDGTFAEPQPREASPRRTRS